MLWRSGGSGGGVGWSTGEKRTRDFDHVLFWVIYCAGEQQLVTERPPRFRDNLCAETERIPGSSDRRSSSGGSRDGGGGSGRGGSSSSGDSKLELLGERAATSR